MIDFGNAFGISRRRIHGREQSPETRSRAAVRVAGRGLLRSFLLTVALVGVGAGLDVSSAFGETVRSHQVDATKRPSKLSTGLRTVADAYRRYRTVNPAEGGGERIFRPPNGRLRLIDDYILVDAVAATDSAALAAELEALGARDVVAFGAIVSGEVPLAALDRMESLATLKVVRPSYITFRTGSVTSQGDRALRADTARADFNLDGNAIRVGVLSDSYDCLGRSGCRRCRRRSAGKRRRC